MSDEPVTDYEIEREVFPAELLARERWFVWALDNDRKIPRAPWANPSHIEKYVSWKDEDEVWTDFETADEWVDKVSQFGHASCIPAYESNSVERLIFFDFDNARDPESGSIHPHAWKLIQGQGLHAAISTSGTGIHGFGWGSLPEGYKVSFEHDLDPWTHGDQFDEPASMEVYAADRFMALTGEHIEGTPVSVPDLGDDVHDLFERFGNERTTGTEREPEISREELADVESTTDLEDIYDAIAHTRPSDIRMRSTVTEEYSGRDANCARDPSWANSKSGTRLAEFDDHWLYRKGNHRLDALQVVALEEGIIRDETDYPSGEDFVDAVDALRDRGAHIPELDTSRDEPALDVVQEGDGDDRDATAEAAAVAGGGKDDEADTDAEADPEAAETDGGTAAATASTANTGPRSFEDRVRDILVAADNDDIQQKTARHRIARAFIDEYDFIYPEEDVRGWRSTLYVYDSEVGIYEPRGEYFVERELEKVAGDYVTNQVRNEIVGKIERMSIERGDEFKPEPERLVVGNGILDLYTGELSPYTPHEYHRTRIDIDWNPDAGEPQAIDEWFHEIVDDSDVPTLYRLIAHALLKEYVAEKAAILIGGGNNGKSMFLDLVEEFIGGYNVAHRELQDFSDDGFAANNLQGKLANLATEIGEQELEDTTTFKKLTGRDTMDARVKFEKPVTFENFATLMFATNEMPVFGQDNHAIWRRWLYIDFPYTFDADDPNAKDPEPERLIKRRITQDSELEALLVRCQQEIQRWHEGERFFADAMDADEVRDKMKKAAEPMYAFATTCLDPTGDEEDFVEKSIVRAAYRAYAKEEDLPRMSENEFGKRLMGLRDYAIESGQKRIDGVRTHVYRKVQLTPRGRQVLGIDEPDDDQTQVDDGEQTTKQLLDIIQDLVEQNGNEPVSKDMVIGRASGKMGLVTAENAFDDLLQSGRIMETGDGVIDK